MRDVLTLQLLWLSSVPRNSLWCFSIYLLRWCFICRQSVGQGQEHVHPSQTHMSPPSPLRIPWIPSKVRHQAYPTAPSCPYPCTLLSPVASCPETCTRTCVLAHTWLWEPMVSSRVDLDLLMPPVASSSRSHRYACIQPRLMATLAPRPLPSAALSSLRTASNDTLSYGPSLAGVVGTPGTWAFVTCSSNLAADLDVNAHLCTQKRVPPPQVNRDGG